MEGGGIQITVIATGFVRQPKGETDEMPVHLSLPPSHLAPLVAAVRVPPRQEAVRVVGHTQIHPAGQEPDSS
jgi:hypothetical protein